MESFSLGIIYALINEKLTPLNKNFVISKLRLFCSWTQYHRSGSTNDNNNSKS